ncbi:MAG: serine hydrolase [Ignavibacteriaceae bacterium]|nr:serine hydrolase [Ignavibacteriaceae bacterium]
MIRLLIKSFSLLILFFILITSCSLENINETDLFVNQQQLNNAFTTLSNVQGMKSIVVSQGDSIVKEQYFNSSGPNVAHDVRSVTKTVTALLIGIAIDKGFISSVEDEIGNYLSPIAGNISPDKSALKIKHLLTMSSGLEWYEWGNYGSNTNNEYNNWWYSSDQITYLLNRNFTYSPGTHFNYNSAGSHLLSIIVAQSTGMDTESFAKQFLFEPLGITFQSWRKDKRGYNNGAAGLFITPYDMQKIGNLLLYKGLYKYKRVVSEKWIDEMTRFHISTRNANSFANGYGYQTWLWNKDVNSYFDAMGYGGQFILVVPAKRLVITATCDISSSSTADSNWYTIMSTIHSSIIPSFR